MALTDSTGAITKNYQFDAFGNELIANDNDNNPFRYCGEYYDTETGLIYLRNRYYDTATGRFTQEDPVKDGLNWYVYCANNPVMFMDPWGLAPSVMEAALMAEHVYEHVWDEEINSRRIYDENGNYTNWRMIDMAVIGSMKIGVYVRGDGLDENSTYTGPKEYALVSKGTNSIGDWDDNLLQPIGFSNDMYMSIYFARWFVYNHSNDEITFVGHSKGGAEAIANAVATNRACITFNPAFPNLWRYNLGYSEAIYTEDMTHYIVRGEILNDKFGVPGVGRPIYLDTEYPIEPWTIQAWEQRIENHHMKAVKSALRKKGY